MWRGGSVAAPEGHLLRLNLLLSPLLINAVLWVIWCSVGSIGELVEFYDLPIFVGVDLLN